MRLPHVAAGRALVAARASMSAEQRWTAGVALLLTLAVLLFGHPGVPVLLRRAASPGAAAAPSASVEGGGAGDAAGVAAAVPVDGGSTTSFGSTPSTPGGQAVGSNSGAPSTPGSDVEDVPAPTTGPPALRVVALVTPGGVPGRDDATAAETFVAGGDGPGEEVVVADPADAGLCDRVAATADVAVAGLELDDGLRRCLADRGVVVLAFDGRGPVAGGRGAVVSTRRALVAGLGDTVRWGVATGALDGPVGLVAASSVRKDVEGAAPAWREAGIDLAATAFVDDDATAPPTADVRRFATEGVEVVLFVVPAAQAGRWALQHSLLDPTVRYVVGDAFDAVWEEGYPPVLDGALALTSLRVPWSAREQGETELQAACRERWEGTVVPPVLLPGAETVRVLAWCQHAALVAAVSAAAELTGLQQASPLTSDLGPLADGGWGPRQDAVLSWSAACRCWESMRGFEDRPG